MTTTEISPLRLADRIELLDVLRGLAVLGILIGNMQWFSGYGFMPSALAAQAPVYDQVTTFLVHFLVEGKFYSIFSFLFGFGFAMQIARAEERGDSNASLFKRRLFWLLIIGLLHAFLTQQHPSQDDSYLDHEFLPEDGIVTDCAPDDPVAGSKGIHQAVPATQLGSLQ